MLSWPISPQIMLAYLAQAYSPQIKIIMKMGIWGPQNFYDTGLQPIKI